MLHNGTCNRGAILKSTHAHSHLDEIHSLREGCCRLCHHPHTAATLLVFRTTSARFCILARCLCVHDVIRSSVIVGIGQFPAFIVRAFVQLPNYPYRFASLKFKDSHPDSRARRLSRRVRKTVRPEWLFPTTSAR